jgi:ribonuclease P protein component
MKRESIRSPREFRKILDTAPAQINRNLIIKTAPGDDTRRLGLVVTRKVGNAIIQNRLKRVLREAFWSLELPPGDYIVIARSGLIETDRQGGMLSVQKQIKHCLRQLPQMPKKQV